MRPEQQFLIFFPNSKRQLSLDYPELYENEDFRKLNRNEQLFVWYYACKASPYHDLDDIDERLNLCIFASFGSKIDKNIKAKYMAEKFPEKIQKGLDFMSKFEPSLRIRAKILTDKMLINIEKLIDVDVDDADEFKNKDGEMDWSKKKAYIDSCEKATKMLPELIRQAEESYGVRSVMRQKVEGKGDYTFDYYEQTQD